MAPVQVYISQGVVGHNRMRLDDGQAGKSSVPVWLVRLLRAVDALRDPQGTIPH